MSDENGSDDTDRTDINDLKRILEEMKENPELAVPDQDAIDILIGKVISIEKKHLYQVESTSNKKRLDEIRKLLDSELSKAIGE